MNGGLANRFRFPRPEPPGGVVEVLENQWESGGFALDSNQGCRRIAVLVRNHSATKP